MTQNENDVVPLIFFFFFTQNQPLIQLCTTNYRPLRASLRSSTLPHPVPLNVVLINIHPGRRGAQQTENMNLDKLQPRDPFIARPTFPSRKRRRSGYIIIKVSRVFETTNDILFFLFPSLERIVFLGQDYKENGGNACSRGWCLSCRKEEKKDFARENIRKWNFQMFHFDRWILILMKCIVRIIGGGKYCKNTMLLRNSYGFEFWVYMEYFLEYFMQLYNFEWKYFFEQKWMRE